MAVIDGDPTTGDPGQGPTTIFVSYSRTDQARALPIIQLLQQAGFNTWWDGLLEGSERFSHTTEDALNRAKAVVVLWSKTSVQSHWFMMRQRAGEIAAHWFRYRWMESSRLWALASFR